MAARQRSLGVQWQAERDTALGTRDPITTPVVPARRPSEGGVALRFPPQSKAPHAFRGRRSEIGPMKSRRAFLKAGVAGAAACLAGCEKTPRTFPGTILGAGRAAGHRLRDAHEGTFPAPSEEHGVRCVIIGGGIAGLAAARRLAQRGMDDFLLVELEPSVGGNSASGSNHIAAYPWGAHYLPIPNDESTEVIALLGELNLIRGRDATGALLCDEEMLCADPNERLFDQGRWHEGLVPQLGLSAGDREQYARFSAQMDTFRHARGSDGRRAFSIPLDLSSRDAELIALDRITMSAWLAQNGCDSAPLLWHVDYCCRDDYGAGSAQVSAWAGIHYFASRNAHAAATEHDTVFTWPEGNGWLVRRIAEPVREHIRTGCIVFNVEPHADGARVDFFDLAAGKSIRLRASRVICAAPRFVAQRFIRGIAPASGLEYSPWMVANITLDALPAGHGAPLAWDNVMRGSRSLGYVVATHQHLHPVPRGTVLTHYWPLDDSPPRDARTQALACTHADWCAQIVADLRHPHADIAAHIRRVDVWLWGHGMIRPVPGFIWGDTRRQMLAPHGAIHFAHSDMSGISIFEEAYTRGCHAADAVLASAL